MLDKYIKAFSKLRTAKARKHYPAITNHCAPHKPFLLLSIMDLIARGQITRHIIEPSFELTQTWNGYYSSIMPPGSATSMAYPFFHLHYDGFWHLIFNKGFDDKNIGRQISSMKKVREIYAGAKMDDELFHYLCETESREQLRAVLITTYFAPEIRHTLLKQGVINYEAFKYAEELVADPEAGYGKKSEEKEAKVRDQGFRRMIIILYEHRCSLCGIRMLTPEGKTAVEAAHIIPWSESHDDRPGNGMALCRLCHWSFDVGLMGVGKKYEVLVSKRIQTEQNLPGHIMTLKGRNIITPDDQMHWPRQDNFQWHLQKKYQR